MTRSRAANSHSGLTPAVPAWLLLEVAGVGRVCFIALDWVSVHCSSNQAR